MSNLAYDDESELAPVRDSDVAAMQELRPVPRISIQAFCVSDGVAKPIERMAADRRMAKTHMNGSSRLPLAAKVNVTSPSPVFSPLTTSAK